jgi:DNA-binding NarL/FixJ family response regulator
MNDRMTHDIKRDWSRFGPDRRLLTAGARHRLPASSTDADNHMPGMGDIEATRRIRAAHPDLMVVLMSTYDVEDLPAGAADCGAAAYLHKEHPSPDLLTRLWRAAH